MARNERLHDGERFSAPVPAGTLSGAPVLVYGVIPAVTQTKEGEGGNITGRATVWTKGVFDVATADAIATEGAAVYITAANVLTATATGNTLFGRTVADADGAGGTKGAGAGTVHVRLAKV
jgi:hypothetical protein